MELKNGIPVGERVPLVAQLHDGLVNKKVTARIYGSNGELLETLTLASAEKGLYISSEYKMPDAFWVTAVVEVEGLDSLEQEYAIVSKTFRAIPKPPPPPTKAVKGFLIKTRDVEKIFKGDLVETCTI